MSMYKEVMPMYKKGSITVFMTLVFLLIVALILVSFESAICFTSPVRVRGGARAAAMSAFGNYNKELYEEYGLLGYGGFDGKSQGSLQSELATNLQENLKTCPDNSTRDYMNLYPISQVNLAINKVHTLTEEDVFLEQIQEYLLTNGLSDVLKQEKDEKYDLQKNKGDFVESLKDASAYEHGKFKKKQENSSKEDLAGGENNSGKENAPGKENASGKRNVSEEERNGSQKPVKDCAGGNPLKFFCSLLRKGMLSMVCNTSSLSQEVIPRVYSSPGILSLDNNTEDSAADWFTKISDEDYGKEYEKKQDYEKNNPAGTILSKGELLAYGNQVLSCYVTDKKQGFSYGLEYLISGNEEEQSNLCGIVNRLFILRLPINYLYVAKDPGIVEKSKATALAITSLFLSPELEESVAQLILLILAAQESFVDIAALLDGRQVPLIKNSQNFQMKYEEICMGSPTLFQQKAKKHKKSNQSLKGNTLDYKGYLMGFLMFVDQDTIRKRIYDLLQFDLRQRYNQTFSLRECISAVNYQVSYKVPFLWKGITGFTGDGILEKVEGFYSVNS